jgi:hypothetical protein
MGEMTIDKIFLRKNLQTGKLRYKPRAAVPLGTVRFAELLHMDHQRDSGRLGSTPLGQRSSSPVNGPFMESHKFCRTGFLADI